MPFIIVPRLATPSYETGFAPRDGAPAYPGLRKGLVGAWAPALGMTGGKLRDISGRGNDGTLTNMDPATDWSRNEGRLGLDFTSATPNEFVKITGSPVSGSQNRTLIALFNCRSNVGANGNGVASMDDGGYVTVGARWSCKITDGSLRIEVNGGGYDTSLSPSLNEWHLAAYVLEGTTLGDHWFYLDGLTESATGSLTINTGLNDLYLGAWSALGINGKSLEGHLALCLLYDRALSVEMIRRIDADPLAPLRLRDRVAFAPAAAGTFQSAWANRATTIIGAAS